MIRALSLPCLFAGFLLGLSGCTPNTPTAGGGDAGTGVAAPAPSKSAGTNGPTNAELKIGISQEFENLNPIIMQMMATNYMYWFAGRSLVNMGPDAKWYADLAKSIPSFENGGAKLVENGGKKKIVSTWEIRDNAQWGDGEPITCADFSFSREIALSNTVSVGEREIFSDVESLEWDPKSPQKCVFTFGKPKWDFYTLAQFYPLPKHIEGPIWAKYGKEKEGYEKNTNYVKNPTMPGLYNGPYRIADVALGDHVTFVANPKWWGKKASIQKIIVKLISNTATMEANLRSGTIDMISSMGLTLDQAIALEKKVKAERLPYDVNFTPSLTYEHIDTNTENAILKDVKVRKALVTAINRDDLVKSLFEGKQPTALHFVSPKDANWYTDDPKVITQYRYSKREAGKLFDEAGWKMQPDGIRAKGGQRLSIDFATTAGDKTRELVQTYLQEQWKQAGVEILIKNQPAKVFFGESVRKRKFDGLLMYAWTTAPENTPRSQLHSNSIPGPKNGYSGQNVPGWINPAVDKDIEALELEFDAKKRQALIFDIEKLYTEEVPVLPMYYRSDTTVTPKNMKGYRMTGHQFSETNSSENWSLE